MLKVSANANSTVASFYTYSFNCIFSIIVRKAIRYSLSFLKFEKL